MRTEAPGEVALYFHSETVPVTPVYWDEFGPKVRALATRLRELGVQPGDRVASTLPNIPEAVIAMLATTSIGAIWTSVSPDFGWRGVLDRFRQLQPRVLICTGGYVYNGKSYDRSGELRQIVDDLGCLEHVIYLPHRDVPAPRDDAKSLPELLAGEPVSREEFRYHYGPFGMPLWILFSSGTTGLPKAITHSHGGILLEQLKLQRLNMNLGHGDVLFFYTTTGWMMWNFMVSSLVLGVKPLLYDGNPGYPEPDALWRMAAQAKVTLFGGSPAYADMLAKRGVVPKDKYDLSALQCVMLAGSPVSPEVYAWFYRNVKRDLWLHVGSGGTDVCTGFTGGSPTLPTYAGEHQHRSLGVAAYAFNDAGEPVVDEVGEMVITRPMPSMPVKFWGDDENMTRYKATYFDEWPGIWRQGDFFKVTAARRHLRARPVRRHVEPVRRADRHRRDLQRPGGHPRGRRRDRGQPRPAGRALLHADVRQAGRRADAERRHRGRDHDAAAARVHAAARAGQVHPGADDPDDADREEARGPGPQAADGRAAREGRQHERDGRPVRPGRVHRLRANPGRLQDVEA